MKIVIIRIKGTVNLSGEMNDTLDMLRLKRKHACVVIENTKVNMGMIKKVENFSAYGEIDKETLKQLIEKRAELKEKRKLSTQQIDDFFNNKAKLQDFGIKPFFRLSPPRQGFKKSTKLAWPVGILGNHGKEINKLLIRML